MFNFILGFLVASLIALAIVGFIYLKLKTMIAILGSVAVVFLVCGAVFYFLLKTVNIQ